MTNEYGAGKLSIMKCDQCRDGYLIVKPGRDNNFFLGCTNYKKDGTGCGKVIWKQQYYEMLGLSPDTVEHREVPKIELESKGRPLQQVETKEKTQTVIAQANVKSVLYKGLDLNYVIHTILQCLSDLSEKRYYGVTVLVDVLRRSKNQRIKDADLNATKNYGALSNVSREDLEIIIEWLIEKHFILKTKGMYPVLHPTYDGTHYSEKITKQGLNKLLQLLERE
jgi:DNA helicase-4